jgi:hypothetical protein
MELSRYGAGRKHKKRKIWSCRDLEQVRITAGKEYRAAKIWSR